MVMRTREVVYINRRERKCACVGGASNVPLGFRSLTENLRMIGMAVWIVGLGKFLPCKGRCQAPA